MNYEATLYYKNQPSSAFQVVPAQPSSSTPKSKTDEEEEEEGEGPTEEKKGEDLSETPDELRSEITPHQQRTTTQMVSEYANRFFLLEVPTNHPHLALWCVMA